MLDENLDKENAAFEEICRIASEIAITKGAPKPQITADTLLLGGELPIDSLDLASIVVQLENLTGVDPFSEGFVNFRTVGELAKLYMK